MIQSIADGDLKATNPMNTVMLPSKRKVERKDSNKDSKSVAQHRKRLYKKKGLLFGLDCEMMQFGENSSKVRLKSS